MTTALRPRTLVLFAGDLLSFFLALWLSLYARAWEAPSSDFFLAHLSPFGLLFIAWVAVFFIAGLYESRLLMFARRSLSSTLLIAQVFNTVIAALFFFLLPVFGIAPKTLLVIYSIISFALVFIWRAYLFPWLGLQKKETAVVVGEGPEIDELVAALRAAPRAPVYISEIIAPGPQVAQAVRESLSKRDPLFVVAHWQDPRIASAFPGLVNYLGEGVRFIDAMALYEEVFGRVPLSRIDDEWLARHISRYAHTLYDPLKRFMDIVIGLTAAIVSLLAYPFIALAIKIEDGGAIFIAQERVGEGNQVVRVYKFRSMERNDIDLTSASHGVNQITRVGRLLRVSRLDELPQLWSVVRGNLSLIGPRPELPSGVAFYEKEIPYYGVRHLIKPGLSGWAQLYHDNHPHHGTDVEATREKLSYDLYYLKHRSLVLDGAVVLKTIKKLLTRSGV